MPIAFVKQLCCQTPTRRINLGWVSFQTDDSISFGLNDRTFISPKFKAVYGVWSAYNRVKVSFGIESDPATLEPVQNPHFTYHPPGKFQLKDNRSPEGEQLFFAIALVDLTVRQQRKMQWLAAYSAPFHTLRTQSGQFRERVEELVMTVPDERLSACMEITFVPPNTTRSMSPTVCYVPWGGLNLEISLSFTSPRIATLMWFHSY